jgi:hypothetical protein
MIQSDEPGAVFRIRELRYGSAEPYNWITYTDPDPTLAFANKNRFFCLLFIIGTFTSVFIGDNDKLLRSYKTIGNQGLKKNMIKSDESGFC